MPFLLLLIPDQTPTVLTPSVFARPAGKPTESFSSFESGACSDGSSLTRSDQLPVVDCQSLSSEEKVLS